MTEGCSIYKRQPLKIYLSPGTKQHSWDQQTDAQSLDQAEGHPLTDVLRIVRDDPAGRGTGVFSPRDKECPTASAIRRINATTA